MSLGNGDVKGVRGPKRQVKTAQQRVGTHNVGARRRKAPSTRSDPSVKGGERCSRMIFCEFAGSHAPSDGGNELRGAEIAD